jgi:hypothetical protein
MVSRYEEEDPSTGEMIVRNQILSKYPEIKPSSVKINYLNIGSKK